MPRSARPPGSGALAALALGLFALAGCTPYVQGNGVYRQEDRTPPTAFNGIHVQDGIEATVTSGAAQPKVVVSGDANFLPYLDTEVVSDQASGPVLHVRIDFHGGSGSPSLPPRVVVDLAELRYLSASGAITHVDAKGVATDVLTVVAHDRSDVVLAGPGGLRIGVEAASARVDAGSYPVSEGALVDESGGARVELHSDGPVTGTARGGSTLDNLLGAGGCTGVVVPAGETATLQCAVKP